MAVAIFLHVPYVKYPNHLLTKIAGAGLSQTSVACPDSPIPDEVYQLAVLWKGIWSTLIMQKRRLQTVEEAWKAFETKKEAFVNFLTKAEERMQSVFKVLSSTKDLAIMNAEFGAFAVRERESEE